VPLNKLTTAPPSTSSATLTGQDQIALTEFRQPFGKSAVRYIELVQQGLTKTFEPIFSKESSTTLSERYYLGQGYERLPGRYSLEFEYGYEKNMPEAFWGALVSIGSLTIIPIWEMDYWRIEVALYNPSGERIFSKQYYDGMKTRVWMPLIFRPFYAPEKSRLKVTECCIRNMTKCMIRDVESVIEIEKKHE